MLPVLLQTLAGCCHKVLGRACLELLQQEYGKSHFKFPPSLGPGWVSTFILTALGFGVPPVSGLCRAWAWAEGNQPGEDQVVGREGLRPSDERPCCSAHPGSSQHILSHDTDSAGPGPRGRTWWGASQEACMV